MIVTLFPSRAFTGRMDRGDSIGPYQFLKIMRNLVLINAIDRSPRATGSHQVRRLPRKASSERLARALPCVIGHGFRHLERGGPTAHIIGSDFAFVDNPGARRFQTP